MEKVKNIIYDLKGNLINELKNGKGFIKDFDDFTNLIYEGKYLNGLRHGKGKLYINNNYLSYEGKYLKDNNTDFGKEYNSNNKLCFEGEFLYNFKFKGRYFIEGRLEYEGEFLFDRKYNGKRYDGNGNIIYELINGNGKVKRILW